MRRFAMDVRKLDIGLNHRINPFGQTYAILAKTMSEDSLQQVATAISAKGTSWTTDEAKEMAVRATTAGEVDRRLRLIFANGTESNLLLRSPPCAFYNDPAARRLALPESGMSSRCIPDVPN